LPLLATHKPSPPDPARAKLPVGLRLKAWWDGNELVLKARAGEAPPEPEPRKVVGYRDPARPWETHRIRMLQAVWGEGFWAPGRREYGQRLAKPFGLTPAMSLLDLGAGLGGPARACVEEFGVWVSGVERDPELAAAGKEISTLAGLAKKAEIAPYDPENFEIPPRSFDCIIARETLFTVADKARLLRVIEHGLKPHGQFVFTDYVLSGKGHADKPAVKAWIELEPVKPHLWTLDEYTRCLRELKFDIRVAEDETTAFRNLILSGWSDYTLAAANAVLDPDMARCLVQEVEIWARRVAAIDAGDLGLYRVYALKTTNDRLLANW